MTDSTARLGLPYILTGQAQKEVTHNDALDRLDAAVQLAVSDRDLTAPPASPAEADAYLVAAGASGAWAGKDGQVAAYYNGWQFLVPREGWLAWVADEEVLIRHTGGGWTVLLSAFGQDLAAAQDAVSARTTLGAAALSAAQTFSGGQRWTITALADGATITPDFSLSNDFTVTLGGNRILANPTNVAAGQSGVIHLIQDGIGSRTLAWGAYWNFAGGTAPVLSTTAAAIDVIAYSVRTATSIVATLAIKGA